MENQLKAVRGDDPTAQVDVIENGTGGGKECFTPWLQTIACGMDILREPSYNKGSAFTDEERDSHYIRGLLPPAHITEELQIQRVLDNIHACSNRLDQYVVMTELQERNERLFYMILTRHTTEMMPIVYTPTVGEACQKYGLIFRRPRGLYISLKDKGRVLDVIKNWPQRNIKVIVVTDGERILGLGDLGVQGMGIPVGKLALYTALGGVNPSQTLPITIDVGTNNEQLLKDPYYLGLRQNRTKGQEYDDLIHEFMVAVKRAYGETVYIQYEDFGNENAFRLMAKYATTHLTANDDIQGTAAVALAGVVAALPVTGGTLADHTFLLDGAGEAGTGIAEITALLMTKQGNITLEQARKKIFMVDSKGLITKSRPDSLEIFKQHFAHDHEEAKDFLTATKAIKPSVIIGTTTQGGVFTKEILQAVASYHERPIVMALSNPTDKSECTAEEAYKYTEGRALFGSGSPFDPLEVYGKMYYPQLANNSYIFPGVGLGSIIAGAVRSHDDMFVEAAVTLAKLVTPEQLDKGMLYPPMEQIRDISAHIAASVAKVAYDQGLATKLPQPKDLLAYAKSCQYNPSYNPFR
ncbi:unnamed protein product [Calypogeia fissa]